MGNTYLTAYFRQILQNHCNIYKKTFLYNKSLKIKGGGIQYNKQNDDIALFSILFSILFLYYFYTIVTMYLRTIQLIVLEHYVPALRPIHKTIPMTTPITREIETWS